MPDQGYGGGADVGSNQNDQSFGGGQGYDSGYGRRGPSPDAWDGGAAQRAAAQRAANQRAADNRAEQEERNRQAFLDQLARERADIKAAIEARMRSAAGVGGRREAIGFASIDEELGRFGFFDTLINHLPGLLPGTDVTAKVDFAGNQRHGNQTTFSPGEAIGEIAGSLLLGPAGSLLGGKLGSHADALAAAPKPGEGAGQGGGKGKGSSVDTTENKTPGQNTGNKSVTTDSKSTANKSNSLSDSFGGDNQSGSFVQPSSADLGAPLVNTEVPEKPINSTTSNGTPSDDLFELYRRMLGGLFRGTRV